MRWEKAWGGERLLPCFLFSSNTSILLLLDRLYGPQQQQQ